MIWNRLEWSCINLNGLEQAGLDWNRLVLNIKEWLGLAGIGKIRQELAGLG